MWPYFKTIFRWASSNHWGAVMNAIEKYIISTNVGKRGVLNCRIQEMQQIREGMTTTDCYHAFSWSGCKQNRLVIPISPRAVGWRKMDKIDQFSQATSFLLFIFCLSSDLTHRSDIRLIDSDEHRPINFVIVMCWQRNWSVCHLVGHWLGMLSRQREYEVAQIR